VDAGSNVLVRIYGPGGVGTGYSRLTGYGSLTRPYGSISGLAYSTTYYVIYTGSIYQATTNYPTTLPDGYEFVGTILTTAPTSPGGSGATATAVIDGAGHVIQINPVTDGSDYLSATVNISGGGGSGASAIPNIVGGAITSYTVTSGGAAYATVPTVTIVPGTSGGTTGGGGSNGGPRGNRFAIDQ
jgi:hypothetical protein